MILKIYGSTDAENIVKILVNSGYRVVIIGYNDERQYQCRCEWFLYHE